MTGFFDVHCHILPGVDDGAANEDMSREMLEAAWKDGITEMLVTPHYHPGHFHKTQQEIKAAFARTCEIAKEIHPAFRLHLGSELYSGFELPEALESGQALTLAESRFVLVEFSPARSFDELLASLWKLKMYGYRPILAHAERYTCLVQDSERVAELWERGIKIQVNAGSITGDNGFSTKRFCKKLLKQELIHLIGSDAHNAEHRPPKMAAAAAYIEKKCGASYARAICREHAESILRNEAF